MSFLKSKHSGWLSDGTRTPFTGGGSGGGSSGPTQTTVQNTNIPEYARPYVESMLGTAQQQVYTRGPGRAATPDITTQIGTDESGQPIYQTTPGTPASQGEITGFRPYVPYGATVNASGNITNTAQEQAGAAVAPFSPLQQQAIRNAGTVGMPGQFNLGTGFQAMGGAGALQAAQGAQSLMGEALGYGQAGQMYGDVGQMYGAQGAQQAQAAAQNAQRQAQMFSQGAVRTGGQALGYGAQGAGYGQGAVGLGQSATELARQQGLGFGAQGARYGQAATGVGRSAAEMAAQQGLGYGAAGAGFGSAAASLAPVAQQFGQEAADIGMGGLGYGAMGAGFGGRGAMAAEQGFGAGEQFARQATDPYATQAYMSPYMQNVVDVQKQEAMRDFAKQMPAMQAQAVRQGAFGGSRSAIEAAEARRNLNTQLQNIQATGTQQAFQDAQRQQQFGANLGLQGLQAGYGGLGLGMQGAGVGLSGLGTALQGQQGRMQGLGQAGQFLGQGMQGAQTGLQGLQGALAGSSQALQGYQAGMQGAGVGLQGLQGALAGSAQGLQGFQTGLQGSQAGMQGVQGALQGYQTGLSGIGQQLGAGQLGLQGTAQGIQGSQAGMQGAGLGLQGVGQAVGAGQYGLQGFGAATQAGSALGQMGGQQLAAQQGIIGLQSQAGAQQQQLEQQKINQAIQNYAMQQQYPMQQLAAMSGLLRGLPLQSATTQSYQAPPSAISQLSGLGLTGAAAYGLMKKEGGIIKSYAKGGSVDGTEDFASGGITRKVMLNPEKYSAQAIDRGTKNGLIDDIVGLAALQQKNQEAKERQAQMAMAQGTPPTVKDQILAEAQQLQGIDNAQSNLPTEYAGGGIVAFQAGGDTMGGFETGSDTSETRAKPKLDEYVIDPMTGEKLFSGYAPKEVAPAAAPAKADTGIKILPDEPKAKPSIMNAPAPVSDTGMGAGGIDDLIRQSIGDIKAGGERDKDARKEAKLMAMLQAGLGIASGTSPYALSNVKGALPALQGYQEEMRGLRGDEAKRIAQIAALNLKGAELKNELKKLGISEELYKAQAKYYTARANAPVGGAARLGGAIPPNVSRQVMQEYKGYLTNPAQAPFFSSLPKDVQTGLTKYKPGTASYNRSLDVFKQYSNKEMMDELGFYGSLNRRSPTAASIED